MTSLAGIETGNSDANKERSLLPKLLPNEPGQAVMETDSERSGTQEMPMKWDFLG
jgi:hypothetical protein